ncbi:MAG TPA: exodeoxyribonuclease VII small subunit [Pyrinomonadaceae bacterium]|nr:exodeoxyribonuclease VII small subunit [Pyrinomonadaceae bacterium]
MKKTEAQSQNFEASLSALEKIVRELERGELPLEKSLELFERGVRLSRECQERLQEAERRIEVLLQRDGGAEGRAGGSSVVLGAFQGEEFDRLANSGDDEGGGTDDDETVF